MTMPAAGAPPVPHVSPPLQPPKPKLGSAATSTLILQRNRETEVRDDRIAEAIVLNDIRHHAFEPRIRPTPTQAERFAGDAELRLEQMRGHVGEFDVIGDTAGLAQIAIHDAVRRGVSITIEERVVLFVIPVTEAGIR